MPAHPTVALSLVLTLLFALVLVVSTWVLVPEPTTASGPSGTSAPGAAINPGTVEAWSAISVALIGLATLVWALLEYSIENRRKRAKMFLEMRKRFKANTDWVKALDWFQGVPGAPAPSAGVVRDLLGFFEEVALLSNSGFIPEPIAQYMFGSFAFGFARFADLNDPHWAIFAQFVADHPGVMHDIQVAQGDAARTRALFSFGIGRKR